MFPNTSRCTSLSSCHCANVAVMPDTSVMMANTAPSAMASWWGLGLARDVTARTYPGRRRRQECETYP